MNCKDQLRDAEKLNAWLYSIPRSTLNDHYRKNGRNRRLSAAYKHEQGSAEITEDGVEKFVHICKCVRGLVPGMRPDQGELIRRHTLRPASDTSFVMIAPPKRLLH